MPCLFLASVANKGHRFDGLQARLRLLDEVIALFVPYHNSVSSDRVERVHHTRACESRHVRVHTRACGYVHACITVDNTRIILSSTTAPSSSVNTRMWEEEAFPSFLFSK